MKKFSLLLPIKHGKYFHKHAQNHLSLPHHIPFEQFHLQET